MSRSNWFNHAAYYKAEIQRADELARKQQLRKAVQILSQLRVRWSSTPAWKQHVQRVFIGDLPEELSKRHQLWQSRIKQAVQSLEQAKQFQFSAAGDPTQIEALTQAVKLYQKSNSLLPEPHTLNALQSCQEELHRRYQFKRLVDQAEYQAQQCYFKEAYTLYQQAYNLYPVESVEASINYCQLRAQHEESYVAKLQHIHQLAQFGQFEVANSLLIPVIQAFPRADGRLLLNELNRVLKGKQHFKAGLLAEQQQDWQTSEFHYR